MFKFKNDYTILINTFEDFILLVYAIIDDLYKQFVPQSVSRWRNVTTTKMSNSEIIALSICGEVVGIDSKKEGILLSNEITGIFSRSVLQNLF